MINNNKHTPLSADHLIKLMDEKSSEPLFDEGFDDFEREALEGFKAHLTPAKAKQLTDEINNNIFKKIAEEQTGSKKKIIWFSAAASIVLLFVIAMFFFNSAHKATQQNNLALNTSEPLKLEESEPVASISAEEEKMIKSIGTVETENHPVNKSSKLISKEDEARGPLKGAIVQPEAAPVYRMKETKEESIADNLKKSDHKNEVNTEKQTFERDENQQLAKKQNLESKSKELTDVYANDADATAVFSNKDEATKVEQKLDGDAKNYDKSTKQKSVGSASSSTSPATTKTAPAIIASNTAANYNTNTEKEIQEYVTAQFLKKNISLTNLKGSYKANISVKKSGKITVKSVTTELKDGKQTAENIKNVLNEMEGWNPLLINNKAVDSDLELKLNF